MNKNAISNYECNFGSKKTLSAVGEAYKDLLLRHTRAGKGHLSVVFQWKKKGSRAE